jgi:hypothetical protein
MVDYSWKISKISSSLWQHGSFFFGWLVIFRPEDEK